MTARRWCLAWVLTALVCAQALGFMHRVVHTPPAVAAAAEAHEHAGANWVATLFAAHDAPGCRLFDAMGHCGLPLATALPVFPVLSAGLGLLSVPSGFIDSSVAPFQARGPPDSR